MDTTTITTTHLAYENSKYTNKTQPTRGGWKSAIFIIFVEVAQRFAYYGVSGNLITYLTNVLHQSTATAAKNVNIWHGVAALFPILGAFIADSYLGRFNTILLSSIIYLMGLVLLTISVSAIPIQRREVVFFAALYTLAVGEGGHKPCVQTFAADQFNEDFPAEKAAKSSFFNWWYLGIVCGSTAAIVVVIYVEDYVGWAVGFGLPTAAVAVALAMFLIGKGTYRRESPVGSPFTRVARVFVAAVRKWRVSETGSGGRVCYDDDDDDRVLARTNQFSFLDKAMIMDELDTSSKTRNPWRLCSVNQVEEVKLLLSLFPIWVSCLMFYVVVAQQSTYFTKQGSTMIRSIGGSYLIPAASLQVITGLTILITVPLYDRVLVPWARRITGHPSGITMLQRIGAGIFLSTLLMVVSALVETQRVSVAKAHGLIDKPKIIIPMSVWWMVPQYVLSGIADALTVVGMQELFYDQMPDGMRSVGAAAYISAMGVGSFLSTGVISIVQEVSEKWASGGGWLNGDNLNRAHLDNFYWVLAGLSGLGFCAYLWAAKGFSYKKVEWNELHRIGNLDGRV